MLALSDVGQWVLSVCVHVKKRANWNNLLKATVDPVRLTVLRLSHYVMPNIPRALHRTCFHCFLFPGSIQYTVRHCVQSNQEAKTFVNCTFIIFHMRGTVDCIQCSAHDEECWCCQCWQCIPIELDVEAQPIIDTDIRLHPNITVYCPCSSDKRYAHHDMAQGKHI